MKKVISICFFLMGIHIEGQIEISLYFKCKDKGIHSYNSKQEEICLKKISKWFTKIQMVKLLKNERDTGLWGQMKKVENGYCFYFEKGNKVQWVDTNKKFQPEGFILFTYDSTGRMKIIQESSPPVLMEYNFLLLIKRKGKTFLMNLPVYSTEDDSLVIWMEDLKYEWTFVVSISGEKIYFRAGRKIFTYFYHKKAGIVSISEIRKFKRKKYN